MAGPSRKNWNPRQRRFSESPTRVELAGRTDSGVHASGQVAALSAETRLDAATVRRALNAHLPEDVAVRDVREAPAGFDPRRWARRRWYRYTINNGARDPLTRRTAWHVEGNLDLAAMQLAASALTGKQDFIACSGKLEEGRTSVRTVFTAGVDLPGRELLFDIEADAFLPQMVRRLTGALVRIGRDAHHVEEFVRLLTAGRTRDASGLPPRLTGFASSASGTTRVTE